MDELIGNDTIAIKEDIKHYHERIYTSNPDTWLENCLLYHRRYPNSFPIIGDLCHLIVSAGHTVKLIE